MPRGFGSDMRLENGPLDGGFGSPHVIAAAISVDRGFGSVRWVPDQIEVVPPRFQFSGYPDEGGVLVRLMAAFPTAGPYKVRLTSDGGATMHPVGKAGCYSGILGQGALCYTSPSKRLLIFVLPPLPIGSYDVVVDAIGGQGAFGQTIVVGGLGVFPRTEAEETYSVRSTFPPRYATGPRSWELEDGTVPTHPTKPLRRLTRAFGQVAQQTAGTPQTWLTIALTDDAGPISVASTLGFPDTGEVWVRERRYAYAQRNATSFGTLTLLTASDQRPIPPLTEVTCHAPALLTG
jgi:hypothetical protein